MSTTDTPEARVAAYFARADAWQAPLAALRALVLETPLVETWKWRSPCYTWQDSNCCTLWRLKDHCGLSFFKGVLLEDGQGLLTAPGPNSRAVRVARFTEAGQVDAVADPLRALLAQAVALERSGARVTLAAEDLPDMPDELAEALAQDPALAKAFDALTPGRRRGYLLHLGEARQARTRRDRIARVAPRILAGKGLHDR